MIKSLTQILIHGPSARKTTLIRPIQFLLAALFCVIGAAAAEASDSVDYFSQYLIDSAKSAMERKRYDQAADFVNRALENHPENKEFLKLIVDIQQQLESWPEAEKRLDQLIELAPGDSESLAKRGLVRWHMGKMEGADEDLSAALERGGLSHQLRARAESARTEARAGRRPPASSASAKSDFSRIDEDWSIVSLMEEKGDWVGLERFYTRLIQHNPQDAPYAYSSRGFARLSQGRLEEARADFNTALTLPNLDQQTKKVVRETLKEIDANRKKAAEWEATWGTIARLEARSDWAGLNRFYTEMLNKKPDDVHALSGRGFVRMNLGRVDEGEADLRAALQKDPDPQTRQAINDTLQNLEQARQETQAWENYQIRESQLRAKRDWAGLDSFYTELIEQYPDNAFSFLASRGYARLYLGRQREARIDFVTALAHPKLDDYNRRALEETLADLDTNRQKSEEWEEIKAAVARLEAKKDWPGLERYYTDLMKSKPHQSLYALTSRGYLRLGQGRLDQAEADFQAGLNLNPDSQTRAGLRAGLDEINKARSAARHKGWDITGGSQAPPSAPVPAAPQVPQATEETYFDPYAPAVGGESRGRTGAYQSTPSARTNNPPAGRPGAYVDVWPLFAQMQGHLQAGRMSEVAAILDRLPTRSLQGEERGHYAFFKGEVLRSAGEHDLAYARYEEAARLITEKYRLSDALWRLAEYNKLRNNREQAAEYGRRSADLLPDQYWRASLAGYLFAGLGRDEEAVNYFQHSLSLQDPNDQEAGLYMNLARAYMRLGDDDNYMGYTRRYIDRVTEAQDRGALQSRSDAEELYDARRAHSYMTRSWGLDSYIFANSYKNDDYSIQTVNELYYQFKAYDVVWRPYLQANGSLASRYSGTYFEPWTASEAKWMGHSHLRDSFHAIAGLRVYPFPAHGLALAAEQVFKVGRDTRNDTRLRLGYFWHTGLDLEPYVPNWTYLLSFNEGIYSTRNNDLTAFGEVRAGRSFRMDGLDDRLVISPYAGWVWGYGGRDVTKGERWSLEAGPGVSFRKWYREDKYNAPQSSFDVSVQYRWGLSHNREDTLAITLSNSF